MKMGRIKVINAFVVLLLYYLCVARLPIQSLG